MSTPDDPDFEARMSFTEHLGELRTRIIRAGLALVISVVACFLCSDYIYFTLKRPLDGLDTTVLTDLVSKLSGGQEDAVDQSPPTGEDTAPSQPEDNVAPESITNPDAEVTDRVFRWMVLSPLEYIFVKVKIATYFGALFALPFILYQVCAFIFPGLLPPERRAVQFIIAGCGVLAIFGVGVAYLFVFPVVMPYLLMVIPEGIEVNLQLSTTIDIIIKGLIAFAVAFQFPMAVLILVYLGLLTPQTLRQYRRVVIVVIAVISAILTPPDPITLVIMMVPMVLLYEASIWASYLVVRRKKEAATLNKQ